MAASDSGPDDFLNLLCEPQKCWGCGGFFEKMLLFCCVLIEMFCGALLVQREFEEVLRGKCQTGQKIRKTVEFYGKSDSALSRKNIIDTHICGAGVESFFVF